MKNVNLIRHLRYKPNISMLCRTRNEWDPAKNYPYEPVDEHVEPKKEDIVREIFDKNYYHFAHRASQSDNHAPYNGFDEMRLWQLNYLHPTMPFLGWTWGPVSMKYLFALAPLIFFVYTVYLMPNFNRRNFKRSSVRRYNTAF